MKKIVTTDEIPSVLKNLFDIDEHITMGLIESVNIQSLSVPENDDVEVYVIEPGEKSGILHNSIDAHGSTKRSLLVESTVDKNGQYAQKGEGKFAFVLMHDKQGKHNNHLWRIYKREEG